MTGFSLLPTAPEEGHNQHQQNFRGISRILGPKWIHLPTITVGLLGVQILWSVEMSYGVCYPNTLANLPSQRVSFTLLAFPGTIQVKHGCCLCCGTPFWTYRATTNRHIMRHL
jgi:solute carrier family 45, member 1/2/4